MIRVLQHHFEKLLVAAALVAFLAGAGWTWRQEENRRETFSAAPSPRLSAAAYVPATLALTSDPPAIWRAAPPQSAGSGWVYELFTPPMISYNATTRAFAVVPPDGTSHEAKAGFGLQLVAVHPEPYRLQLAGYFGSPGDYVVAFTIPGSPGTVLARAGRRFEELGLTFKTFEVKKVPVDHANPRPVYDVAGLATVEDHRAGAEVVLDTRTPKLTNVPLAVFEQPGKGAARERHEGDTWIEGDVTYRVERIQLESAEVVVARTVPGRPSPETETMHPLAVIDARSARQAGGDGDSSTLRPRNVANNGP